MPSRLLRGALLAAAGVALPAPAAELPEEAAAVRKPPSELARRPDERRRDAAHQLTLFGRPWRVSGQWEASHAWRQDFDLDPQRARDRARLDQELKLEASWAPDAASLVFVQLVAQGEIETQRQNAPLESHGALERGQMWLYRSRPAGLPVDLQLGRLSLVDVRSWWWDDDVDALRLFFGGDDWIIDTGFTRRLLPVSTAERGAIDAEAEALSRWFGRAAWAWGARHSLEAFWLLARDRSGQPAPGTRLHLRRADPSDADLDWFGLRAIGEARTTAGHRVGYWVDLAWLHGNETLTAFEDAAANRVRAVASSRRTVSGHAWDLGLRWSLPGKSRPTVWAGWAVGSGDADPGDGRDGNFRQSGLEENKARFGGVKRFHYYGELMRPALSNLSIASLGASLRFFDKSSVDLVIHDYRQRRAAPFLAGARLDAEPDGERPALGQEIDLFLSFRESPAVEFTVSLAALRAGAAFGARRGETAWYAELGVSLNF